MVETASQANLGLPLESEGGDVLKGRRISPEESAFHTVKVQRWDEEKVD